MFFTLSKENSHMSYLTDVSLVREIQTQSHCGRTTHKCGYWDIAYCKLLNSVQLSIVFSHKPVFMSVMCKVLLNIIWSLWIL